MTSPHRASRRAVLPLLAALCLALPVSTFAETGAPAVTVFAAASLKNAMDAVIQAFSARTGVQARASYGASSALARQIEQGAPADVFVSADADWMDYLAQRKLIRADSRRTLISNHLALIAPADSPVTIAIGTSCSARTRTSAAVSAVMGLWCAPSSR